MENTKLAYGQKVPFSFTAKNFDGSEFTPSPTDTVLVTSLHPDILTVSPEYPPQAGKLASGFLVAGKATGFATVKAQITHKDGTPAPEPMAYHFDVVPDFPTALEFSVGSTTVEEEPETKTNPDDYHPGQ